MSKQISTKQSNFPLPGQMSAGAIGLFAEISKGAGDDVAQALLPVREGGPPSTEQKAAARRRATQTGVSVPHGPTSRRYQGGVTDGVRVTS